MRFLNRLLLATALCFTASWLLATPASAKLKVAALHPLMGDLGRQVGGENVELIDLMSPSSNPHLFEPSASDLRRAADAKLYLASGKHLETYLDKLRSNLGNSATILEVGRKIPSQKIEAKNAAYACCPAHVGGAIDPHWWHDVANMQRAAKIVADEFSRLDPANKSYYQARAKAYRSELTKLNSWMKRELSTIPRSQRRLATAHASFGYFCKAYGFKAVPVLGVNAEHEPSASYTAEVITIIRKNNVRAVFPEKRLNPKILQNILRETGIKTGGTLIGDGSSSYTKMMQHNTQVIVQALR
ncbi:metal ABC transporter substrate-binding protein [Persicirhabdus sediminis]|uniref:Zinc ABC transporter substrate-binding protein n=1 Tax=Persicirhabdus sediminis TaxID=454144 RepID=A0A8J7ME61_9BACT|nr:metal ABC transporter substrate-binding protein [Persicirhabdus sediminis]MBK1790888.1 zinc ABC transporter substrate-binding protein [Persicirhabdus sediminis]